ncbi:MAG: YgiT-type zinc finger protein [bacterium]|nr:YgiT-type zinc finger protein [bacterium]
MECLYCDGEMELQEAAYTVDRKGYHLYLENIPTYVCAKCGERAYDEKEAEAIQGMIAGLEEGIDKVRAAV